MPSVRHPRRALLALICSTSLVLTPGVATAGTSAPPDAAFRYESGQPASGSFGTAGVKPDTRPAASHFDVDVVNTPVAPGLTHTRFDRYLATGWVRANLLTADLGTPGLRLNYVGAPSVSSTEPMSSMLRRNRAVAGVNGDFFDIGDTGAPLGVGQQRGRGLLHAPASGWNNAFLLSGKQQARIATTFLDATVRRAGGKELSVTNLNSPTIARDGIGIYTSAWGADARSRVVPGQRTRQVVVRNGKVRSNTLRLGTGAVPQGATVLVGVGRGARQLKGWKRGNRVAVRYSLDTSSQVAIGGNAVILRKGKVLDGDPVRHPRTAIGVDATGRRVFVLTVDGRAAHSTGVTHAETARILKQWGAVDALNLDGGGSSTMMARHAGTSIATMNHTSDGRQRSVPNGLAFRVVKGSTKLGGFHVRTAGGHADDDRVLRGLGRTLTARAHTGRFGPASARPAWSAGAGARVRGGRSLRKVVVGHARGPATVTARRGSARGTTTLRVLGPVHRLEPSQGRLSMSGPGASGHIELRGYDASGYGTWVEPRDVRVRFNSKKIAVSRSGRGFTVRAKRDNARAVVTFAAGGVTTRVPVTTGGRHVRAHGFDAAGGWRARTARAAASLTPTTNRAGRTGTALQATFRVPRAKGGSRHVTLRHAPIRLRPKAQDLRLWVRGDGSRARIRLGLKPKRGASRWLTIASRVSWTGWRQVRTAVPAALRGSALTRIRIVPGRARAHSGRLAFDDLTSTVPWAAAALPALPRDASVQDTSPSSASGTRVAVLGDVGVSAAAPTSTAVRRFRAALRAAKDADVDQVLLTGDVVARGTTANLAFARSLLNAELGRTPWAWVAGDSDRAGDLANYRSVLGAPVRVFDRAGLRFVTLNSAGGTMRSGGFDQLVRLRTAVSRAVADRDVRATVVGIHHPVRSLVPGAGRRLADRREADLVEDVLGNVTGKGTPVAVVSGHGRRFQATRYDGALSIGNGPVAGSPAGPASGSFIGWTLLELVDNRLQTTFVPTVDSVALTAPSTVERRSTARTRTTIKQGSRTVRLAYPMAATWKATTRVHVGAPDKARFTAYLAVNPRTGAITGLRRGTTDLTVEVGGRSATTKVRVD